MRKINLNQYFFHGMEPWDNFFNHKKPKSSIEILEKILNTGYIASRRLLKEILSEEEYKLLDMTRGMNWNKNDYVSIGPTIHPEIEGIRSVLEDYPNETEDWHGFAYNHYIKEYPSIILDSKLLKELEVNEDEGPRFIGEIQVRDRISSDYFVGVTLPKPPEIDSFLEYIDLVNSPNGGTFKAEYKLWYEEAREDLLKLSKEEFVRKYYKKIMLFEEVLKETDSSLKLYYIDGRPILTSEERIEQVAKIKEKCF